MPDDVLVQKKINSLPVKLRQKINAYTNREDKILRLAGKLLLQKATDKLNTADVFLLDEMTVDANGKPWLNNVFFSMAYTKNIAVCAVSATGDIGIDIEKIEPINHLLYEDYFTKSEWMKMNKSIDTLTNFYNFWTRKEAVLKACGQGIQSNLQLVDVVADTVAINNKNYQLQKIDILPEYSCHLASGVLAQTIEIGELNVFEM